MHCKRVPVCNNLLQTGTQLQCKCVPICNNLLQIGTQLHYICVPICNNLLQIGTLLQNGTQHSAIFKPALRQYWTNIASMLDKHRKACQVVHMYQQTRDIKPMLVYSWRNVYAACQTVIQHWFNVSCSLGTCSCPANTRRWPNVGLISAIPRI